MSNILKSGVDLIAEERERQATVEGYRDSHDDDHDKGELAAAAECYLNELRERPFRENKLGPPRQIWPWDNRYWKPTHDPVRQLVKAGALIAAEIDRLQRASESSFEALKNRI
jgi:hypothetical protein